MTPGRSIFIHHGNSSGSLRMNALRRLGKAVHAPPLAQIRAAAGRIGRRVQANHRRADRGRHVSGPRIRRQQHGCLPQQCQHLRQRVAADLVSGRTGRRRNDTIAHVAFDASRTAAKHHAHIPAAARRDRRLARRIRAASYAIAWLEQGLISSVALESGMIRRAYATASAGNGMFHSSRRSPIPSASANPQKLSSTCSRRRARIRRLVNSHCRSRALARSNPHLTGARTRHAQQVGTKARMQVQNQIESPSGELSAAGARTRRRSAACRPSGIRSPAAATSASPRRGR